MKIRSILFKTYFYIMTALVMLTAVVFLPFSYKPMSNHVRCWGKLTYLGLRIFCNIKFEVRGLEYLPKNRAVIIACKHQSAFETAGLFHNLLPYPAYALKASLNKIPLWRAISQKAGALAIERDKGSSALKLMVKQAAKFINENRSLIIFPEGTRIDVKTEGRYLPGVFALCQSFADVAVVPAAINSGMFWSNSGSILRSGTIVLEFLAPMDNHLARKDFMADMKNRIESKTRHLEDEVTTLDFL